MTILAKRARPPAEYLALRDATRRLIVKAGGVERAAKLTAASRASLARYYSDDCAYWIGIDNVLDLEGATGAPIVTQTMAELLGYRLVPVEPCAAGAIDVLAMVVEVGELAGAVQAMDADGRRSVNEIRAAIAEAQDVLKETQATLNALFVELEAALSRGAGENGGEHEG